jgi:predicted glycogen debranching enzyme
MSDWVLRMPWAGGQQAGPEPLVTREWLVTNGLGGYASGTVAGLSSRRYHGLLIAALPAPLGRQVMLNHLSELVRLPDGTKALLGGLERKGGVDVPGAHYLTEFRLDTGLPVWVYRVGDAVIEKRILLPHMQNTALVNFRLVSGDGPVRLKLRPSVQFRPYEAPVNAGYPGPYSFSAMDDLYELHGGDAHPPLRLYIYGQRSAFTVESAPVRDFYYRIEQSRGYESEGNLYSPGYFRADVAHGHDATLVASTEPWTTLLALKPPEAWAAEMERRQRLITFAPTELRSGPARELVLAADQFLMTPAGRVQDAARARAAGDEVRSVIAGYHWFTDWGRDTMISLEGLTLATGRHEEAGYILRTFGHYVRDGLLPNFFPDGEKEGLYHTADATLWFFHAIDRYLDATGDRITLRILLPKLRDIVAHHVRGTRFGIGVDHTDGLLKQGAEGYQLTWMDAKVGDWVVTPRRGKAVEINALWYNALKLLEGWVREEVGDKEADELAGHSAKCRESFNQRFWYEPGGHLYDVVDGEKGDDAACRPNQIFAISLPNPVLDESRWQPVFDTATKKLLTPVGLRTLAPDHPEYKAQYYGDLRARDAAYHQGTVWAWLIGPYVDAWRKLNPDDTPAGRHFLQGFVDHMHDACIGSISEIFDAEPPYTPRGCIAQAWSVAEVLRSWLATMEDPAAEAELKELRASA